MHVPQTEVILKHDSVELAHVTLPPGDYVIGRSAEVDIHAETPLLSRRHAKLTIEYDQLFIQDLGSSNGTFVNEQSVKEITRLFPNQSIRLGPDITLEVRRHRTSSEPDLSLAPKQAAIRRYLPEELLTDRRYAIGGQIAQGGMGAILDAKQMATQRTVAMKVMLGSADEGDVLRFIEEAQVTAQLEHPNIVPVHELGVDEQDQVFYTMKMVRGITLKKVLDLLAQGIPETVTKYPLPTLLTIFQKVCDAIAFAHSRGVIHRDLKPENIMLDDFGVVLVMDWGIAKVIKNGAPESSFAMTMRTAVASVRSAEPELSGTHAGAIMGTPNYMSPEQARGENESLDVRSDIYTLGAILYRILTLHSHVSGRTAGEIIDKTGRGEIEPLNAPQSTKLSHLPGGNIPESLAAVVRKGMALDKSARYQRVEDLQRDLNAYQTGFATSAEKASFGKQFILLLKRHKGVATSVTAAALILALVVAVAFFRVTGEKSRAEQALADLKKTAPAFRQLAESEAAFQHFDSALNKLDASLALDPTELSSYWRRAWLLTGMDRLTEAAAAIRLAQQKDPVHTELAGILPTIDELASLSASERWTTDAGRKVWNHLVRVGASGETVALSAKLNPGIEDKLKMVRQRLDEWLGKGNGKVYSQNELLFVKLNGIPIDTVEPLRGFPIGILDLNHTNVSNLEPLRGMHLESLKIGQTKVTDLSPLIGMPLRDLSVNEDKKVEVTQLQGLPLEAISCGGVQRADFSSLRGKALRYVDISRNGVSNLAFLSNTPLVELYAYYNHINDLSPLRGKPLETLIIYANEISDLTPLQGAPIVELDIHNNPITDFSPLLALPKLETLCISWSGSRLEPLRHHPSLKFISYGGEPKRPVADFWKEYDAQHPAEPK